MTFDKFDGYKNEADDLIKEQIGFGGDNATVMLAESFVAWEWLDEKYPAILTEMDNFIFNMEHPKDKEAEAKKRLAERPDGYGLCVYCKNYKGQDMYDWNKCSKCLWLGGGEDDNWEAKYE